MSTTHLAHTDTTTDTRPETVRRHLAIVLASIALTWQLVPNGLESTHVSPGSSLAAAVPLPAAIDAQLRRSCYDCHSNSTVVPWYGALQPIGGWMAGHVREGRRELNFDRFGEYRPRRQLRKLEQIAGEVRADAMPLPSYLLMHGDARLSDDERAQLYGWVDSSIAYLRSTLPPDSLAPRR